MLHYSITPIPTSIWQPYGSAGGAFGIYFDGTYVWVTNPNPHGNNFDVPGSVVKIRASDQAYIAPDGSVTDLNGATYQVGTGNGWSPVGVSGDGTNIWVLNSGVHQIVKLRASDGVQVGAYGLGAGVYPHGPSFEFDGTYFWACVSSTSGNLLRVSAANGTFTLFNTVRTPLTLTYDSVNSCLWVYCWNFVSSPGDLGFIRQIGLDGSLLNEYPLGQGTYSTTNPGIITDGEYVWFVVGQQGDAGIAKIRCSDGAFINPDGSVGTLVSATFSPDPQTYPHYSGLIRAYDPLNDQNLLYIASYTNITAMQVLPGGINGLYNTYQLTTGGPNTGQNPFWFAWDGINAWVTDYAGSFVGFIDPYNAEFLAGDCTLSVPGFDGSEVYAQNAYLISTQATCPPIISYINNNKNQPPLSTFIL